MITAKELAEKLNGRAYGDSFDDVEQEAKESGLVIVYGASDDLMEFDGARNLMPYELMRSRSVSINGPVNQTLLSLISARFLTIYTSMP